MKHEEFHLEYSVGGCLFILKQKFIFFQIKTLNSFSK